MSTVNGRPDGGLLYPRVPIEETVTGVPNGGTTGQVLGKLSATDQDTGWIDQTSGSGGGGGGALVFLKEVVLAAGASADFTDVISSLYDDYELVYEGLIPGTNAAQVGVQLSADNGATWITTGYRGAVHSIGLSTNFSNYQQQTAQPFLNLAGAFGNTKTSNGKMELYAANTSSAKRAHTRGVYGGNDGNVYGSTSGSDYDTATTFNALRVIASSGTITGTFRLYGRTKSAASVSAPAWVTYHPDTPPSSPTLFSGVSYDQEFVRDATLSGHTVLGAPTTAPSIVDRALRVVGGTSSAADAKVVVWTAPTAPYTMTAKVRRKLTSGSFGNFGIVLRRSSATRHTALICNQSGGFTSGQVSWDDYTALTTRSGFGGNVNYPVLYAVYFRLVNDGTNLSYQVSTTGHPDSFVTIATRTIATALGGAADQFGVSMDTFGTTALTGYCEWIRFT